MIIEATRVGQSTGATPKNSGAAPAPAVSSVTSSGPLNGEELRQAVAAANRATKSLQNAVQLSLDSQSGKAIVRVIDTETGQLIRQIPSEEVLELRRALDRISGLIIQRTA
jgi:flagellar protein FlaG